MSEITLSAIEHMLDEKLKPIKNVMAKLATSEELNEVKADLADVKSTLHSHTTALDSLSKNVKTLLDEKTISAARIDRLEKWARQVGEKTGVKLDLDNLVLQ